MPSTLTIRDESAGGKTLREFSLDILTERITVRELIRSRVYQEVKDFNAKQPEAFQGLIQPEDAEQTLNGSRRRQKRRINWKRQFERALAAFRANQILILVDDRQLESLDEEIEVKPDTTVAFLRLTLLTGG